MSGLLEGRVALVTGSTSNIGLATARAFAREGATVVVHSRSVDDTPRVVGDVADPEAVTPVDGGRSAAVRKR